MRVCLGFEGTDCQTRSLDASCPSRCSLIVLNFPAIFCPSVTYIVACVSVCVYGTRSTFVIACIDAEMVAREGVWVQYIDCSGVAVNESRLRCYTDGRLAHEELPCLVPTEITLLVHD